MTKKNNATCSICGGEYHICLSCQDSMKLHPWKIHCCSAVHFQIFQIVRGFSTGVYTKDEAKEKLKNVNLEDLNSFRPHIKKVIEDILEYEATANTTQIAKESVETEVVAEENIIEDSVAEDVVNGNIEDVIKTEKSYNNFKTTYSRKKNYK